MTAPRPCLALALLVALPLAAPAQKEYGFDNRKSSGQPYLSPEETVRRMKVADGFEVKLFAAEPMLVNPIAFTIDERGRVWAVESFEYPKRTPKGKMPRDRIVILEDTDGDGVADKRTVFAEGKDFPERFDMASGIEVGHGGVFLGAPPYLWFIENKNDKPGKFEKLLSGFGSQDTHETLNTFQWGPDGWLYGLHGIYTQSNVTPASGAASAPRGSSPLDSQPRGADAAPLAAPVEMNAAMWRYHPTKRKFEVVAEGTSNPWGWDYRNTDGQMIACCCVIPHLFHITPGGVYKRQSGQSQNPYAYGYLNEICDHTFHKESGWAHAGLLSLDTPLMSPEYRDSVIFGSIHGCSVKRNVLKRNGSTYIASRADDFLQSGDKNVRPLNLRWGPNGDIYLSDWHDQNPCSQADPDSWDYERGRIYRIQKKGAVTKKAEDLGALSPEDMGRRLGDPNPYIYRTILRLTYERRAQRQREIEAIKKPDEYRRDRLVLKPLPSWSQGGLPGVMYTARGEWISYALNGESTLSRVMPLHGFGTGMAVTFNGANDAAGWWEWAIRLSLPSWDSKLFDYLIGEGRHSTRPRPSVRLELASLVCRYNFDGIRDRELLHALMLHKEDITDPVIPLMIWLGYEKKLVEGWESKELAWLKANSAGNPLITDYIIPRVMRRLVATGKPDDLAACISFLCDIKDSAVRRRSLEGLNEAFKGRMVDAPASWATVQSVLLADKDDQVQKLTRNLAVHFRDPAAVRRALATAPDRGRPLADRLDAVRALGLTRPPEAVALLVKLVREDQEPELRAEAVRALANFDELPLARTLLGGWPAYPPVLRSEVVQTLAGRREWARELLTAVAAGRVAKTDLSTNTVLRLQAFKDRRLNADIEKVWGKVRESSAEIAALITKMRGELDAAPASFARGRAVFEAQCSKCHRFEGQGHGVGPELDGAGRDIDYLLVNILDPNRVVGQPYFIRRVVLTSGRIEEGLLVSEDQQAITLKGENDAQKTIPKKEVAEVEVIEKSMMPEGLGNAMSVQDFRDLVRYLMANPFVTQVTVTTPTAGRHDPSVDHTSTKYPYLLLRTSAGVSGRIKLPEAKQEEYSYVSAQVTSPETLKTRLLLGAAHPLRVTLNGKLVYEGRPGEKDAQPDQAGVDVELVKGENRLVIEVRYRGESQSLYARFFDPGRKLVYPEPPEKKRD
jgi:putative membrane-bound dehydrogenase-like protein